MKAQNNDIFYNRLVNRLIVKDRNQAKLCRKTLLSSLELRADPPTSGEKGLIPKNFLAPEQPSAYEKIRELYNKPEVSSFLDSVFSHSPYLFQASLQNPDILTSLIETSPEKLFLFLLDEMRVHARPLVQEEELMAHLRHYKIKVHLLIALADLSGIWPLSDVMRAMTRLADLSVNLALQASFFFVIRRAGQEDLSAECKEKSQIDFPYWQALIENSGLFVFALGKCGAGELNYSSDIDLAFFYNKKKWARLAWKQPERIAVRVTQKLIHLLDTITPEGYVFRVDIRLRPDSGNKSPIITAESAETYYETLGQNWERAMLIKARGIAGDLKAGKALIKKLEPYIWRRSLDYNAISDIHSIMRQIHRLGNHNLIQVMGHNIKLGRGGIREIEFFTQVQQLILGGRYKDLRSSATQDALRELTKLGFLGSAKCRKLIHYYQYLRFIENRLQMVRDQQTHEIPLKKTASFAAFCGYKTYSAFQRQLLRCLQRVHTVYSSLVTQEESLASSEGSLVFTGPRADQETVKTLEKLGFERPKEAWHMMSSWLGGRVRATQTEKARTLLTRLAPHLVEAAAKTGQPDIAFARFADFFSALPIGISVLSLFLNNPKLMNRVVDILGLAPRLAPFLAKKPALLDIMVDPKFSQSLKRKNREKTLQKYQYLLTDEMSFEQKLNAARQTCNEAQFKIGAHILSGQIDPLSAGRVYAREAEAVLQVISQVARQEVDRVYGHVEGEWAIIGLGSLGAEELTSGSDLDLTIVYRAKENKDITGKGENSMNGASLSPQEYFSRITRRLITALSVPTEEGILYNVDMQLRPSGISGPKSVQFSTFERYYSTKAAWTWELMALTRARVIVSNDRFKKQIERRITKSIRQKRNPEKISSHVIDIREKLASEHPEGEVWDFKYRRGGLIDIHFIIEYLQIIHAVEHPSILTSGTHIAINKLHKAGFLTEKEHSVLKTGAYFMLSLSQMFQIAHHNSYEKLLTTHRFQKLLSKSLDETNPIVLEGQLQKIQSQIYSIYKKIIEKPTEK